MATDPLIKIAGRYRVAQKMAQFLYALTAKY